MSSQHTLPPAPLVRYGDHPDQVANLHLPAAEGGPWPCVVLLHGGFWRDRWDRTLMTPLARDLAAHGLAAWNVEYRRVGESGGGWPNTFDDVAAAVDALATAEDVDSTRVAAVGHSAGGHLALWLASRADARVALCAAVSLAGVCDLVAAALERLGGGAAQALLGGEPEDVPERYAAASPHALLPLGVPQLLVHGLDDDIVPPAQSRSHAAAAREAGDLVELVELAGTGHFHVVDASHPAWKETRERLPVLLGVTA